MKPTLTKRVRAQRKFPQGVVIPQTAAMSEPRPEPEPNKNDGVVVTTPQNASSLLNQISFQNIHNHPIPGIKEIRIVLDRIPLKDLPVPPLPKSENNTNEKDNKTNLEPVPHMTLRNRVVRRVSKRKAAAKSAPAKRYKTSDQEDNTPLKYLQKSKRKSKRVVMKKLKQTPLQVERKEQEHNSIVSEKVERKEEEQNSTVTDTNEREILSAQISPAALVMIPDVYEFTDMDEETSTLERYQIRLSHPGDIFSPLPDTLDNDSDDFVLRYEEDTIPPQPGEPHDHAMEEPTPQMCVDMVREIPNVCSVDELHPGGSGVGNYDRQRPDDHVMEEPTPDVCVDIVREIPNVCSVDEPHPGGSGILNSNRQRPDDHVMEDIKPEMCVEIVRELPNASSVDELQPGGSGILNSNRHRPDDHVMEDIKPEMCVEIVRELPNASSVDELQPGGSGILNSNRHRPDDHVMEDIKPEMCVEIVRELPNASSVDELQPGGSGILNSNRHRPDDHVMEDIKPEMCVEIVRELPNASSVDELQPGGSGIVVSYPPSDDDDDDEVICISDDTSDDKQDDTSDLDDTISLSEQDLTDSDPPNPQDSDGSGTVCDGLLLSPSAKEAENPIKYASYLKNKYPDIGICAIKLPGDFTPPLVTEPNGDMREFKMSSQYINRIFQRWSLATRELLTIKCKQPNRMKSSPLFEGVELDLVKLYKQVQEYGGLSNILSEQTWAEIMDKMKISTKVKTAKKLEKLYFRYLLGYETTSYLEREDIHQKVVKCWEERSKRQLDKSQNPLWRQAKLMNLEPPIDEGSLNDIEALCAEAEDCIIPNRSSTLAKFRKLAERVKSVFVNQECPTVEEVEDQYWKIAMLGTDHVCVNLASVDTAENGYGFPAETHKAYGDHPWNLKRICESPDNVLSFLEPTLGVSAPTLHLGMTFATSCWHMDPHMLGWIEYLHEGAPKIWYSIPRSQTDLFRTAAANLCPVAVQNKSFWLPADIAMFPPSLLKAYGITLTKTIQKPGEYVIVFPNTYSASIDTGMTISEGVYFAPHAWINRVEHIFKELKENCESTMFPLEQLLIGLAENMQTPPEMLMRVHNALQPLLAEELRHRAAAASYGLALLTQQELTTQGRRGKNITVNECLYCRCTIHLSRVVGVTEGATSMCLEHGVRMFARAKDRGVSFADAYCLLHYTDDQLKGIIAALQDRVALLARQ